jgi:hypothetical protein
MIWISFDWMNFDLLNLKPQISWDSTLELGMDSRGSWKFLIMSCIPRHFLFAGLYLKCKNPSHAHTPPTFFEKLKCEFQSENNKKRKKIRVHSLICSSSGVKGRVKVHERGLQWMTSGPIIHTNLNKPNNKFVNV